MSNSINKVQLAKQILEEKRKSANDNIINPPSELLPFASFKKVTQKEVHDFIKERSKLTNTKGVSIRTIQTYWNYDMVDVKEIERIENERLEITYIPKDEKVESSEHVRHVVVIAHNSGVLDAEIQDETEKATEHKPEAESMAEQEEYESEFEAKYFSDLEDKPNWWQSLDYFIENYGDECAKEMYEGQISFIGKM